MAFFTKTASNEEADQPTQTGNDYARKLVMKLVL